MDRIKEFIIANLQWFYVALGILMVLLAVLLVVSIRKGKKKKEAYRMKQESTTEVTGVLSETETPELIEHTKIQEQRQSVISAVVHGIGAREDQQDSYGTEEFDNPGNKEDHGILAVVADGMGGLSNGKEASSLVVDTCIQIFCTERMYHSLGDAAGQKKVPDVLLEMAREAVDRAARKFVSGERGGSTLVSAIIRNGFLSFLSIGDSRIYLYRGGALLQLNREHVYEEELVLEAVNGKISTEQTKTDPQAKALTSYLGQGNIFWLDRNREGIKLIVGDKILLATDGVFGTLSAEQIEQALQKTVTQAAEEIGTEIEKAGLSYQDNFTAVILEYLG